VLLSFQGISLSPDCSCAAAEEHTDGIVITSEQRNSNNGFPERLATPFAGQFPSIGFFERVEQQRAITEVFFDTQFNLWQYNTPLKQSCVHFQLQSAWPQDERPFWYATYTYQACGSPFAQS